MDNNKETGSYYTPHELIDFMIKYLQKNQQGFSNVLEPSAGDGRFLASLLPLSNRVRAIELFKEKVKYIREQYSDSKLEVRKRNFLDYALKSKEQYSLIIGNPPYINPKVMNKTDLDKAKNLCKLENIAESTMQNMWFAFVVGACRVLDDNGTIFFVLPMEFLQVQYAETLRMYLEKKFNTIHIISFQSCIFPDIEQDVCLVYMTNKKREAPYILYEIYKDATCSVPLFQNVIKKNKPLKKWSNAVLSDENILLLNEKASEYEMIENMGTSAPGVVTGGNKYFIITEEKVKEYNCQKYVLPILQKSSYISSNTIMIDEELINSLRQEGKPVYLLDLSNVEEEDIPAELRAYLDWAKEQKVGETKLAERFKCANRTPWYGVPIVNKGEVVFFKRYHMVPRVYINQANIHTTDAGYHIRLKEGWDKKSLVFCFYNSLTLAQCEFQGRYYGGGVSELVPSEFKDLRIPYRKIKDEDVKKLDEMFGKKEKLEKIVSFVNQRTIEMDMDKRDVERIEQIRKLLVQRRCRNK
ncbi:MAG: N-6 DNA methylase [Lachnospiraceae bacterium]|nr:N-6 DNA methylase [Lachnospiraceae bacterium]